MHYYYCSVRSSFNLPLVAYKLLRTYQIVFTARSKYITPHVSYFTLRSERELRERRINTISTFYLIQHLIELKQTFKCTII